MAMLFDFGKLPAQDRYKLLCATVTPRPIAWVVTQSRQGVLNAAPFSFFNVFASDPPLVVIGVSAREPGRAKDTGANISETGEFVVNMVGAANAEQMNITAIDFPPDVDELAEAGLTTLPSLHVRPPRIAESPVAFECERHMAIEVSSERVLVVGRVLAVHVRDDCVLNAERCYIDTPKLDLIGRMHGAGGYTRTRDQFEMKRIDPAGWKQKS
jgi:flavin reductase (DIM6/NTAB) family NADH-FMN oxidoreductase RutF